MRTSATCALLTLVILTLSIGDADARRRSSHRNHIRTTTVDVVDVVRKPAARTSVFDTEAWQPPVTLPGLVSSYQAYAASQYTFEGKDNLFPTVVYINK